MGGPSGVGVGFFVQPANGEQESIVFHHKFMSLLFFIMSKESFIAVWSSTQPFKFPFEDVVCTTNSLQIAILRNPYYNRLWFHWIALGLSHPSSNYMVASYIHLCVHLSDPWVYRSESLGASTHSTEHALTRRARQRLATSCSCSLEIEILSKFDTLICRRRWKEQLRQWQDKRTINIEPALIVWCYKATHCHYLDFSLLKVFLFNNEINCLNSIFKEVPMGAQCFKQV